MTIDEAIEELTVLAFQGFGPPKEGTKSALKLGIKALEVVRMARENGDLPSCLVLNGETKD